MINTMQLFQTSLDTVQTGLAPDAELLARKAKLQAKIVQCTVRILQEEGREISLGTIQTLSHVIVQHATTILKIDQMNTQLGLLQSTAKHIEKSLDRNTTRLKKCTNQTKKLCENTTRPNSTELYVKERKARRGLLKQFRFSDAGR